MVKKRESSKVVHSEGAAAMGGSPEEKKAGRKIVGLGEAYSNGNNAN